MLKDIHKHMYEQNHCRNNANIDCRARADDVAHVPHIVPNRMHIAHSYRVSTHFCILDAKLPVSYFVFCFANT